MNLRYKAVFISDLHIGSSHCKSSVLLDLLKTYQAETFYLVGDIFDFWKLKNKFHLPKEQIAVLKKFLKMVKKGVKIKYIIGNHDEVLRSWTKYNLEIENIEIANSFIHESNDRRFLVIHGDQFDGMVVPWLYHIGDFLYEILLSLNTNLNYFRHKLNLGYWSLSKYLKSKTKEAVAFISSFEETIANYARKRKCDGVIYGHTHTPTLKFLNDITVMNTGDFVESCSAILEDHYGNFYLLQYQNNSWNIINSLKIEIL